MIDAILLEAQKAALPWKLSSRGHRRLRLRHSRAVTWSRLFTWAPLPSPVSLARARISFSTVAEPRILSMSSLNYCKGFLPLFLFVSPPSPQHSPLLLTWVSRSLQTFFPAALSSWACFLLPFITVTVQLEGLQKVLHCKEWILNSSH